MLKTNKAIMAKTFKIVTIATTAATGIATAGFAVAALTIPYWEFFAACAIMTGALGYFVAKDCKDYIKKRTL